MPATLLKPRARSGLVLAGLATAALATGCGSSGSGNSNADPASVVPSNAPLYASLVVKPEGDQKTQLEAVLKKVLQTNDPSTKIKKFFDDSTKKDGVDYDKDIKPWLGKRAGVFISSIRGRSADWAAILPSSDTGKGLDAVRKGDKGVKKGTYRDVDYETNSEGTSSAAVGDFVVGGSLPALKAVIDTSKDSQKAITNDDDFTKATSEAGKDSLATLYLDPGALLDSAASGGTVDRNAVVALRQALSAAGLQAVGMGADAQANGFTVTFATIGQKSSSVEKGDGPAALAAVPGDSWFGAGIGNLGGQLESAIKQISQVGALAGVNVDQVFDQLKAQSGLDVRQDVIDWMGDAAIFVRGTTLGDIGGGLIIKSKDPQATATGVKRIAKLLRRQGQTVTPVAGASGIDAGFSFKANDRIEIFLVAAGDKFVAAVGRSALEAALKPSSTLGDSPGFQQAASRLGDGLKPSMFFAMEPVLQLVESAGVGSQPDYQKAKPYLQQFTTIVAGGKRTGDVGKGRIVIGVR